MPLFQVRLGRHSIRPPLSVLCADGFDSAVMIREQRHSRSQSGRETDRQTPRGFIIPSRGINHIGIPGIPDVVGCCQHIHRREEKRREERRGESINKTKHEGNKMVYLSLSSIHHVIHSCPTLLGYHKTKQEKRDRENAYAVTIITHRTCRQTAVLPPESIRQMGRPIQYFKIMSTNNPEHTKNSTRCPT